MKHSSCGRCHQAVLKLEKQRLPLRGSPIGRISHSRSLTTVGRSDGLVAESEVSMGIGWLGRLSLVSAALECGRRLLSLSATIIDGQHLFYLLMYGYHTKEDRCPPRRSSYGNDSLLVPTVRASAPALDVIQSAQPTTAPSRGRALSGTFANKKSIGMEGALEEEVGLFEASLTLLSCRGGLSRGQCLRHLGVLEFMRSRLFCWSHVCAPGQLLVGMSSH